MASNTMTPTVIPDAPGASNPSDAILQVRGLRKWFDVGGRFLGIGQRSWLKAIDDVNFDVRESQTFGLVGESGCGKTTTLKVILGLEEPTEGNIYWQGEDVADMTRAGRREFRRSVQAVFQDPWSSLNPRMRVQAIVGEPLEIATTMSRQEIRDRVGDLLVEVGLNPYQMNLYPHEFSGGQRQRIGIARALALNPKLICLDEPVSALDVSIRAQIMNLLVDLQNEHGLAYLLVAHNLATVRYMCHEMAVMYLGVVQEMGDTEAIFNNPLHLYTNALISAALPSHPDITRDEIILPGEVVSPIDPPPGDVFMTRTPIEVDHSNEWAQVRPPLVEKEPNHWVVDTPWSLATDEALRASIYDEEAEIRKSEEERMRLAAEN